MSTVINIGAKNEPFALVQSPKSDLELSDTKFKTIEVAKRAFGHLTADLEEIQISKRLPEDSSKILNSLPPSTLKVEDDVKSDNSEPKKHWTETVSPEEERFRVETPSINSIRRLCYLTTFQQKVLADKVPFAQQDLNAFVESKVTRDRTYRWFKLGFVVFAGLAVIQGFSSYYAPSTAPQDNGAVLQGIINTIAGVAVAGLGIKFTGINPDVSQDRLNDKMDKLNRVKNQFDEVARTLIIFCYYKDPIVRKLAQTAAEEINIENIIKAAADSELYAITSQEISFTLELLKQSIEYIKNGKSPENHELNKLVQDSLKRKEELCLKGYWKN